jgi:hypothetical protein
MAPSIGPEFVFFEASLLFDGMSRARADACRGYVGSRLSL